MHLVGAAARTLVVLVALGAACSSPKPVVEQPLPAAPVHQDGSSCIDDTGCVAPARCIHVVGMRPESARQECWITCGDSDACPADLQCQMIHDGPGAVCRKVASD